MKVIILGPVVNNEKSGGVAVFSEGLFSGFEKREDNVTFVSDDKSSKLNNIVVKAPLFYSKIGRIIKKERPDLVICSLKYSLGIRTYKRKWKQATYIQVLHGFACPVNGRMKAWLTNSLLKRASKKFDHVVSVSELTYAINKKINLINSDKVIINGVDLKPSLEPTEREYDFVYIGRLFKDKGIELICDSFVSLKKIKPEWKFAIAGYGEDEELFLPGGKYHNNSINFLGRLNGEEVSKLLSKSKFFISLNPLEPFGIVFSEAVVNGCNIITQSTSGCSETFIKKPYFHISNCNNVDELTLLLNSIHELFVEISFDERKTIANELSFETCASKYASLRENK